MGVMGATPRENIVEGKHVFRVLYWRSKREITYRGHSKGYCQVTGVEKEGASKYSRTQGTFNRKVGQHVV